jgi:MFS superfamily sulfate permease-like transporter
LIITAVFFVQYDGAVGLTVGAIISILRHAIKESSQLRVESEVLDPLGWLVITSKEALTYVNASQFETQVEQHLSSGLEHNVLDLTSVPFMDMDAIVSLQQIQKYAAKQGQKVYILEPQGTLAR